MTIVLAFDPGFTGALAWLRAHPHGGIDLLSIVDMPTATIKQGSSPTRTVLLTSVLAAHVQNPLMPRPDAVVIEEVHASPQMGVTSAFRFGHAAGILEGVAAAAGLPVHFIRPAVWTKAAGVRKGDDAGRLRATQLFPERSDLFARKMDHNRADAALIGYAYLRQELFQNIPK